MANSEHAAFVVEIAYNAINGTILMAAIGLMGLCGYAWYRLIRWALNKVL